MAKKKPIKIGIVGIGRAGWGMHPNELKNRGDKFQVVAACDPVAERREMMADKFGCATYKTFDALLSDPNIEVVDIASRSPQHVPQAVKALKAGFIVFLEKPIALSYSEAKKLKAAVKGKRNKLFLRHNRRFEPGFQHIREIIDSGILGDVYEIKLRRLSYAWRGDWQTIKRCGGGQLLNWGPHIIDHALRFLGGKVDSVWSDLRCVAALGDAEDHVHIILKGGKKGCVVDLEISGGVAIGEPTYMVNGTRGSLHSSGNTIEMKYLDPKRKISKARANPGNPPLGGGFGGAARPVWIEKEIPVAPRTKCKCDQIWDHLYASIRERKKFPITLEEGLQVMEIISRARKGTKFDRA